ncbi:MAG: hypothetical protein AMXMBFR58_29470 [Phycisphaerae bacterium]
MSNQNGTLRERLAALKGRNDRFFSQLRLRSDLAELIQAGLERRNLNQKQLAEMCGKKESYISRLMNTAANCNIGIVAQVLAPLGIDPAIVDRAELSRLREISDEIAAWEAAAGFEKGIDDDPRTAKRSARIIPGRRPAFIVPSEECPGRAGLYTSGTQAGSSRHLGRSRAAGSEVGSGDESGGGGASFVLSVVPRDSGQLV